MSNSGRTAKEIFLDALDVESHERERFVTEACGDDHQLRQQVEALLHAHDQADSVLDQVRIEPDLTVDSEPVSSDEATFEFGPSERTGAEIGPYKLLQVIGEGGMGVVYMAEQKRPVERRVALKIIKPGMDSQQVIARFEAERQALAMMDHPNIAKVLDAGTTEMGRPYFVMELVNGVPITDYCDQKHLTTQERLELFVPVCQAVQHAHQKGIIHRDLKPSNILVAMYDDRAVPKVIDFGVAKATSHSLTDKTLFTQFGQVVGTLEYMSPEQAQRNQLDIDTRSDVYSLGVVLYELLTGATPFDRKRLREATLDEILRIIREEDPPTPSLRLSSIETLPSVAANRQIEPKRLSAILRGELDWIVMKALDKDRARRYETANGFAADILNYLNDEPVIACPPSTSYRLRKLVRKHKLVIGTTALVVAALIVGIVGTAWQAYEAQKARALAEVEKQNAVEAASRLDRKSNQLETELRISNARNLAVQAQAAWDEYPVRSLLLAVEAVQATQRHGMEAVPIAREVLLNNVSKFGGFPLVGHDSSIREIVRSHDGHWLATGWTLSKDCHLWDLTKEEPSKTVRVLSGHQAPIHSATFDSSGSRLVTTSSDETIRCWDLHSEHPVSTQLNVRGLSGRFHKCEICPDGLWLTISSTEDNRVLVWRIVEDQFLKSCIELSDHARGVLDFAFTPTGRFLITGDAAHKIRMWDLQSTPLQKDPILLSTEIEFDSIICSPNGQWLVAGKAKDFRGGSVQLWEFSQESSTFESLGSFDRKGSEIAVSSDSRWLVAGSTLIDLQASRPLNSARDLEGMGGYAVAFSPDSRWLATGARSKSAALMWDLSEDVLRPRELAWPGAGTMDMIAFSPDSSWIATKCVRDKHVCVWDLESQTQTRPRLFSGHDRFTFVVEFSEDGNWLFTASDDRMIRRWPLNRHGPESSFVRFTNFSMASFCGSRLLATGAVDGAVNLWDLKAWPVNTNPIECGTVGAKVSSLSASVDGEWLAAGAEDGSVRLWNVNRSKRESTILTSHSGSVTAVSFDRTGNLLVTGGMDGQVRVYELHSALKGHGVAAQFDFGSAVGSAQVSSDGRWLGAAPFTPRDEFPPRIWDLSNPEHEPHNVFLGAAWIQFSGDARYAVGAGGPGNLRTIELAGLSKGETAVTQITDQYKANSLMVSPDSRRIVTGNNNSKTCHWDIDGGAHQLPFHELAGHGHEIWSVAMSADGCQLATGSMDRTVRLWDLESQDIESTSIWLKGFELGVRKTEFSPDGDWLLAGTGSDFLLWDLRMDQLVSRAQQLAGRQMSDEEKRQYSVDPVRTLSGIPRSAMSN